LNCLETREKGIHDKRPFPDTMENGLVPGVLVAFQPVYPLPPFALATFAAAAVARLLVAPHGLQSAEDAVLLHFPFQDSHGFFKVVADDLNL
jgi:hypothetical protein